MQEEHTEAIATALGGDTGSVPTPWHLRVTQWLVRRVRLAGMKIARPPISIGHYKMVKHKSDKGNEENPHRSGGWRGVWGGPVGGSAMMLPFPCPFQV